MFWIVLAIATLTITVVNAFLHLYGVIFKKDMTNAIHICCCYWGRSIIFFVPGWGITIHGRENLIPKGQAGVYVSNHESNADTLAIYCLTTQFRWLSKASVFKIPFIGQSMKWSGHIPITRGDKESHKKALQLSAEKIKNNIPMLLFPEGSRSKTGELKEFKIGAFKLASECNVPVTPIALKGTKDLVQKGSALPGQAHAEVTVLPAVTQNKGEDLIQFAARVRGLIAEHHD